MGATLTTVNAITKEVYGPKVVDQLENETVLVKRIEKTTRNTSSEVGGKYVTFPLKVRRNHGLGYRNELEQLQNPGQQGWVSVRVPLRYGYGRVHMSGQTMELVDTNVQAFASAMTEEMNGLKNDLLKDTNRILWGNGLGVLATVDTAAAGVNTISVGTSDAALNWIELDAQVDILSSDGATTRAANRKVTAINLATGDFTFDGAVATVSVGDIVVRNGNYGREPQGLTSLVTNSTASLFNLSSTTEPTWTSKVDATGGALSESKMIAMCDGLRTNGGRPSVIFTDLGTRRAYFNLLTTQRRFTGTKTFEGGFTGLTFSYDEDIPVVTDVDAPAGKMWFIREEDFKVYHANDWKWEDKDGSVWKWVTNYDAFEAMMKKYWEFAIERRNTQAVMTGITAG
jgi:hypothetical protein